MKIGPSGWKGAWGRDQTRKIALRLWVWSKPCHRKPSVGPKGLEGPQGWPPVDASR